MKNVKFALILFLALFISAPSVVLASNALDSIVGSAFKIADSSLASAAEVISVPVSEIVSKFGVVADSNLLKKIGSFGYILSGHKLFGIFQYIFNTLLASKYIMIGGGATLVGVVVYGAYYYFYVDKTPESKIDDDLKINGVDEMERILYGYTQEELRRELKEKEDYNNYIQSKSVLKAVKGSALTLDDIISKAAKDTETGSNKTGESNSNSTDNKEQKSGNSRGSNRSNSSQGGDDGQAGGGSGGDGNKPNPNGQDDDEEQQQKEKSDEIKKMLI